MLTLEQMRKIDPELGHLSDAELEQIRLALYDAVQLAHEVYVGKKYGSKCPVRSFPPFEIKSKLN
jgi:hypothetical protein